MKILITGYTGFLGQNIFDGLKELNPTVINSKDLNLIDYAEVKDFFDFHGYFDFVIHCAVKSAFKEEKVGPDNYVDNVAMASNLLRCRGHYKRLINFCSGAAFDRQRGEIADVKEEELFSRNPKDYYGFAKNDIARLVRDADMYSLRIFGSFNYNERSERFISSCISRCKEKEPITIDQDRLFDFFYAEDITTVVKKILKSDPLLYKDINMCYNKKLLLSEVAQLVCDKMSENALIQIENPNTGNSYTGNSQRLDGLGLNLIGLEAGIQRQIEKS
jgi:nucleoside-diphosphate-sugar epimerase